MSDFHIRSRRDFLRDASVGAAAAAAAASGGVFFNPMQAYAGTGDDLVWDKAPCRFCGTGCGVLVGVRDNTIMAVKGDPQSPVSQGTLCAKGYSLPFVLYAEDRLTKPLIRKKDGKYDKRGQLEQASWDEALDLMAQKAKEAIAAKGPSAVAMFGSGQWTIWEGYAASKIWKAGLKSNSLEVNARHCMASAVAGMMTTFGMDEPPGNYDDLMHADVLISWGANMAEMHPVLFGKIASRLQQEGKARLINLTTMSNRTSTYAEKEILFKPQADLAIANGIANLIVKSGRINKAFVENFVAFTRGKTQIGYGIQDKESFTDEPAASNMAEYAAFLETYTPEYVQQISGVSPQDLQYLADIYADPNIKVMSLWTMGVNQHTRGTWMNNLLYNLHLLTGKISEPGNSPFSLTGQPSACGTCREVGTFTHRLPADMVVNNDGHRAIAEKIWNVPAGTIPAKPSYHAVEMARALDRGDVLFFWSSTTNPFQDFPNLNRYVAGAEKEGRFIVVSDIYPNRSTAIADVVLPSASWVEKEGAFGNSERRTQFFKRMIKAPGESKSDLWQFIEFAKRMGVGQLFVYNAEEYAVPADRMKSDASEEAGFYIEKALFEEYRRFGLHHGHDLAPFETYHSVPGMRWPVVNGKETAIRYREGYDPYVPAGKGMSFYGNEKKNGGKAIVWLRPYEPAPEEPDAEYPMWLSTGRVLEHWHSGTMTRRVPQLFKAYPHATANMHPEDATTMGIVHGDRLRISSRRGSVEVYADIGGRVTPQKGMVYVPWFDEDVMINRLTFDAHCPISKQTDFKKCAVRIEKIAAPAARPTAAQPGGSQLARIASRFWRAVAAVGLVAGCAGTGTPGNGLYTGQVALNVWEQAEPGETQPPARPYNLAPPVVPHVVEPAAIARGTNECFDCHANGDDVGGHIATKIPESHYVNLFTQEKGSVDSHVVGGRQVCISCHVPQTADVPVVGIRAR